MCDKRPSIFDVTGLNLSALLVGFGLSTGTLKTCRRDKVESFRGKPEVKRSRIKMVGFFLALVKKHLQYLALLFCCKSLSLYIPNPKINK